MLRISLRIDDLKWVELMYPAEFELYKLTKPDYVEIVSVENI